VAAVILRIDAPGGRTSYRQYVSHHVTEGGAPEKLPASFRKRLWLSTAVLAMCALLVVPVIVAAPRPQPGQRFLVLIVVGAVMLALRRWPSPILVITVASAALVTAADNASLPVGVLLGLAVYLTATSLPRRTSIRVTVASAAVLGAALLYSVLAYPNPPLVLDALTGYAPLLAGWFVGDSIAARRHYLAGLEEQAERKRAAESERARQEIREERVRIAHELHDVVAHTLAVITVQAGVGRRLMEKRPEEASAALESIETIGRTAQDELRVVLGLLRDEQVGTAALVPAPRLTDLKELADNVRASGTPVELRTPGADRPLSPALELSLYRVVQEALTNVVKHAPGARACVDVTVCDGRVRLEVADDGGPARRPPPGDGPADLGAGHGIVGMRERIAAFGGWLVAEPRPGCGFHVLAEIPVEASV
jgi:signal transduction histidine kinase